mgnify:CR=1 FL=1
MISRFQNCDRVRIKFRVDRGHYGTIIHVGGDDGSYYGVKLDGAPNPVGYSDYELELEIPPDRRALWGNDGAKGCYVPKLIAVCPECGGELAARSGSWETQTGRPVAESIELDCMNDLRDGKAGHRWFQSDWQPVRNRIYRWCNARVDYPNP